METLRSLLARISGIGAATAKRLAKLGAKIILTGRLRRVGQLLANEIKRSGSCGAFLQADLREPEQVRLIVPFTIETFGRLDYGPEAFAELLL